MADTATKERKPARQTRSEQDGKDLQVSPLPSSADILASFLIKHGLLTPGQLQYARRVQEKLATPKTLLQVLYDLEFLKESQLRQAMQQDRVGMRVGDLLVELGYLRPQDLQTALARQRELKNSKKLGEILVEDHLIEEHRFIEVLAYQMGIPAVDLDAEQLDRTLFSKAPVNYYQRHKFVPVKQEEGAVLIAFADPSDEVDLRAAREFFGSNIRVGIAPARAIDEWVERYQRVRSASKVACDERTIVGLINKLLDDAVAHNASDIHIEPMKDRLRIRFRCDGVLLQYQTFSLDLAAPIVSRLKVLAKADIAEKRRHQGGRILYESPTTGSTLDLRVSFYVTIYGEKVVLRLLNQKGELLELKDIGMAPKVLERFRFDALDLPSGVLIVTGPTGSGKTTTLYGCVNYLNTIETSIVTAEDPVEYIVEGISQCSINPKIGVTFEETLRHIVRQDPDVIVLGEIRDHFSAETAIQAALTGHKVLTTFHTEDSIGGLLRLMNMEIEAFLISSTVVCVLAQRLLRKVCSDCAEPQQLTPVELRRLGYKPADLAGARFMAGRGCPRCRFTGHRGRVGIFELLILNEQVKDAILRRKTSYEIRRISVETSGLVTLFEDGLVKAARGQVSVQDVLRHLPRLGRPRSLPELYRMLGE
ncbi:type IV pilus assembly protein PilB [Geothermobacter ehrlichii]|uniref:Type IV pilus assembly protein PilB n=1 Tax=Geothermobacter ehrlichii TaxID=213224 RepID=A0A5D3WQ38_9BACT|nr:GspE/PulE family protein [Geothermobacter ehrlichii]TYO99919.1 type IV pilus assembly protein PilB [Geothermobacter ehrlichii]